MSKHPMRRALFLDRDGVLIKDIGFPHLPEHLVFCEGAIGGLQRAQTLGFELIIVTNQSGLARGIFNLQQYKDFEAFVEGMLSKNGVSILKTYYCPHYTEGTVKEWVVRCQCRKPAPGMLNTAAREFDVNLEESFLVGDRPSDIQAARNAGLRGYFLVGNHPEARLSMETSFGESLKQDYKFMGKLDNLTMVTDALARIVAKPPM
jgi:D-glycero-D-manno-heptose 1,7-bisphosphate phosphatase